MELIDSVKVRLRQQIAARGDISRFWPHAGSRGLVRKIAARVVGSGVGSGVGPDVAPGDPLPDFAALGALVDDRWGARGYAIGAFPDVALTALRGFEPRVRPDDVLRWVGRQRVMPRQNMGGVFSDFQIQVYSQPRFFIEALFWTNGTTTVHEHSFSGAFRLLEGSSMHAAYGFDLDERIDPHFMVGRLRQKNLELLRAGDTRPIVAGGSFIHSLFHLDKPSVTIVVRTHGPDTTGPQYNYLRTDDGRGLAVDPLFKRPELARKLTCLKLLVESGHASLGAFIEDAIATEDTFGTSQIVRWVNGHAKDPELVALALAGMRKKAGGVADLMGPVLSEIRLVNGLFAMRSKIPDPELRFFLALLVNARTRAEVDAMIRGRFPDRDPGPSLVAWLRALIAIEPDFPGTRLDAEGHAMMELLVDGRSVDDVVAALPAHPVLRTLQPERAAARCREIAALPRLRSLTAA